MNKTLILNRLKKAKNFKSDTELANYLGISKSTLSNWYSRNSIDYDLLFSKCEQINSNWLLTGEGDVFKNDNVVKEIKESYSTNMIPLYEDVETIGGTSMVANMSANNTVNEWIDAGDWFNGASAAIRHYGDSMIEYPSGCILVLREVIDRDLIIWGRNYCIETSEYRVTKKIYDYNDENMKAYSSNIDTQPDGELKHPVFLISKQKIKKIYQVLGYVVKEYSNGPVMISNN